MPKPRRKCKLAESKFNKIDLRNFEQIIKDTINSTVPNKNPKVYKDHFSTDLLSQSESVLIGRALAKIDELSGSGSSAAEGATAFEKITVYPMFGEAYDVEIEKGEGGHGGGDNVLREDIFGVPANDPLNRAASHVDGVSSIMTGICANKSMASGMPVKVEDVLGRKIKDL